MQSNTTSRKSKRVCPASDDNGTKCTNLVSDRQWKQDGMCARCADGIWGAFAGPIVRGEKPAKFVFSKKE